MKAQRGSGVVAVLKLGAGWSVVGGQRNALGTFTAGNTRHPLYRGLGGPRDRCRVRRIPPPPPHRDKEGGNVLINRPAVGRKPFWIDEKKSPSLGM